MAIQYSDSWQYWASLGRPVLFDRVVLGDRAASHKAKDGKLLKDPSFVYPPGLPDNWWAPVRENILSFSAGGRDMEMPRKPLITYIDRQATGRRLNTPDHDRLVDSLEALAKAHGYEVNHCCNIRFSPINTIVYSLPWHRWSIYRK